MNPAEQATKLGRQRWLICALLFGVTTINNIGRHALSVLKTGLQPPFSAGGMGLTDGRRLHAGHHRGLFHRHLLTSATGLFPTEVSGAGIGLGSTAGRRAGRCRFAAIARANVVARRFSLLIFLMIDPTIRP